MIWRSFLCSWLALLAIVVVAGCGGGGAAAPTSAPATAVPTAAPTEAPTAVPTEAPTEAPAAVPTDTPAPQSEANVKFRWSPAGNLPADSDDVDDIVREVRGRHEGIVNGYGNEIGLTIIYNPTLITVEEVAAILDDIGHPVEASQ